MNPIICGSYQRTSVGVGQREVSEMNPKKNHG